ncbi:hypothetical protein [Streptomyces sp. NPDC015350]|uniref:hypothetical protein n=1 Tax=Streptomyces sp. NPDC015350 TaxID=3364955 RepID=UPI0036FB5A3D
MTTSPRPLFSVRTGLAPAPEHDGPFDGVPAHLLAPLQEWVNGVLSPRKPGAEEQALFICLQLRIPPSRSHHGQALYVKPLVQSAGAHLLDVVDKLLQTKTAHGYEVDQLSQILDDAGSAYRINEAADGLEERVTPAVRDAVLHTIAEAAGAPAAGSAADHLATAWRAAYGRNPDPVRAYSEAVKAVESAAHAVVQFNHSGATLGSMLGEFKTARHKFATVIPDPDGDPLAPVEAMMRALWKGQTSRHGAKDATVLETPETARASVHLAATLVQWFLSGAVTRTP